MFKEFILLIFPENCLNCEASLISKEKYLCIPCKTALPYTYDEKNQNNNLFQKFAFSRAVKTATAFIYYHQKGVAQKLIHSLKYHGQKELGYQIGLWHSRYIAETFSSKIDFIFPAPIDKTRYRRRGYNQSEWYAKGLAEGLNLEIRNDFITRNKTRKTQTKKNKIDRWLGFKNIYTTKNESLKNKSIMIVDDVITTGATIGMICDIMEKLDVEQIHILAIARSNR